MKRKIISAFTAMMVALITIVGSVSELSIPVSAAGEITADGSGIYANGYAIIIADKDGNDATTNDTLIYLDSNWNGVIDGAETAVSLAPLTGNTTDGYDLSSVNIYGGNKTASVNNTKITIQGGTVSTVYCANKDTNCVSGSTNLTINGGTINGNAYGGGNMGNAGNANVTISGGTINGSVFGGGSGNYVYGSAHVKVSADASVLGSINSGCDGNGTVGPGSYAECEVAFYDGTTKLTNPAPQWVTLNSKAVLPTPALTNAEQIISSWKKSDNSIYNFDTIVNKPLKLYANWTPISNHIVTYNANGATKGTVPTDANSYAVGANVPLAYNTGDLSKTGYDFGGWSTTPNGAAITSYTMGSSNVTFYAVWNLIPKYTVTYSANGATKGTVPTDSNTYTVGANVPLAENTGGLAKTGYTFGGWSLIPNGSSISSYTMGSSNVTFYAVWTADDNSAGSPISISSPGSGGSSEQPISISFPQDIGLPQPELISAQPIGNAFDELARLSILPATAEQFREALRTANRPLPSDSDAFYFEMDMFSQRTGEKLQPKEGTTVKITFPVPTELLAHKENLRTVCVIGGKLNLLPTTIVVKNNTVCAEFSANHFSPYALIIDRNGSFSSLAAGAPVSENSTPIEQPSGVPYIILSLGLIAGIIFFKTKRLKNRK